MTKRTFWLITIHSCHQWIFCLSRNLMTFLVYIETQNFTRIHIEKSTCSTKELSINMTKSLSAVTGGLQSYTVTKSIDIIASIKCGYWDTVKTFWIILILVRYRQFHLSKHLTFLLLTNHSLWISINTFKNFIYNAFIFTMVSNLFRSSLQFFLVTNHICHGSYSWTYLQISWFK